MSGVSLDVRVRPFRSADVPVVAPLIPTHFSMPRANACRLTIPPRAACCRMKGA
jgi:hypothetical protein